MFGKGAISLPLCALPDFMIRKAQRKMRAERVYRNLSMRRKREAREKLLTTPFNIMSGRSGPGSARDHPRPTNVPWPFR
jgi:hypothetical protein